MKSMRWILENLLPFYVMDMHAASLVGVKMVHWLGCLPLTVCPGFTFRTQGRLDEGQVCCAVVFREVYLQKQRFPIQPYFPLHKDGWFVLDEVEDKSQEKQQPKQQQWHLPPQLLAYRHGVRFSLRLELALCRFIEQECLGKVTYNWYVGIWQIEDGSLSRWYSCVVVDLGGQDGRKSAIIGTWIIDSWMFHAQYPDHFGYHVYNLFPCV